MRRQAPASTAGSIDPTAGTIGRSAFAFALASVAAGLLLWAAAVPAQAATNYSYQGESGNGTLGDVPTDAAVDDTTGYLLVVDSSNDRVVVFETTQPGASVVTTFGAGELSDPYGIAVDPSGDVYVADAGNDRIVRYASDGATPPTYTLDGTYTSPAKGSGAEEIGNFASTLAIDPSNGDLLVADKGNLRVERFDSSGAFVDSFDGSDSDAGAFTSLLDIATGADSAIFLIANGSVESEFGSVSGSVVDEFAADGTFVETLAPGQLENARAIGYDGHLDNVLVTSGGSFIEGRNIALRVVHNGNLIGSYEISTPEESSLAVAVAVPGDPLAPFSILTARTVAVGVGKASLLSVKGFQVDVTFSAPTAITGSGAHLSGTVDPHGESGGAHFEYRRVGASDWISNPDQGISGEGPQPVEEDLTGLLANENYEARLTANVSGAIETSPAQTFKTQSVVPTVETEAALEIHGSTAALTGSVNPNGTTTTWYFEYGTTEAYGARTPLVAAPAGSGQNSLSFSREISGLLPGLAYHFRIVAENSAGSSEGADESFVAGGVLPEGRAFELVTGDLHGATIDPQFGVRALPGRPGISFVAKPVAAEAPASPFYPRLLSLRGSSDWEPARYIDPPIREHNGIRFYKDTLAVSDDGEWSFIVSNRKLTPDSVEGAEVANLYRKNLRTGALEHIATTQEPGSFLEFSNAGAVAEAFLAGAPDLSWIVFESKFPLLPGVTASALYRWSSDKGLELVSKLPGDTIPTAPVYEFRYPQTKRNYVTADGTAIEFGFENAPAYVREGDETTAISVSQLDGEEKPAEPVGISLNGRYAYFNSAGKLTPDATETPSSLYRYDLDEDTLEFVAESYDSGGAGGIVSHIYAISGDGASIAYVAPEGAPSGIASAVRLVVWHEGEVLPAYTGAPTNQAFQSAQFSPDGRYLAFSDALAPYIGSAPPEVYGDVFIYDIDAQASSCASCKGGKGTKASFLPLGEKIVNNRLPQVVDDQGRVFFGSAAPLVPRDSNGQVDVYVFRAGQAELISPGNASVAALPLDMSADGRDVYFSTEQALVASDLDREIDIYDARIGGGLPAQEVLPPVQCSGEACQGPPPGPLTNPKLGSETSAGTVPRATKKASCEKKKVKKKGKCVKRKGKHQRRHGKPSQSTGGRR